MALTPIRWITLAAACCALLFFALMGLDGGRRTGSRSQSDTVRARLAGVVSREGIRTSRLAAQFRIAQLLDSTSRGVTHEAAPTIRVFTDAAIVPEGRPEFEALVRRAALASNANPRIGIDVYFDLDTVRQIHGLLRSSITIPIATYQIPTAPGERCVVFVRIGKDPPLRMEIQRVFQSQAAADQLLGPCGYYRAFGMPGPQMARWLIHGGWFFGTDGSWTRQPAPIDPGPARSKYFASTSVAYIYLTPSGLRCAGGDSDYCASQVIGAGGGSPLVTTATHVVTPSSRLGPRLYGGGVFGVRQPELLAGMVRSLGRDRFERIWMSSDSLPAAFQRVAGQSLGSWAFRWMVAQYGIVESGPRVGPYALVMALLVAALSFIAARQFSVRRRYA